MLSSASLTLQIHSQPARLGMESRRAELEIQQPQALLEITQPPARMSIDQGPGRLEIDSSAARAALGGFSTLELTAQIADQARQVALQAIGDIAAEGDRLGAIESTPAKGAVIADIARDRQDSGITPIDYAAPPSTHPVSITYMPHPTQIDWQLGRVNIHSTPRPPEYTYHSGMLRIYLEQRPELQIDVRGRYMNQVF